MFQGYFFHREDQALHGFSKFFRKNSDEEREHAQKLMDYQNHRGGTILLKDVEKPKKENWNSILEAVEDALALEKAVNKVIDEILTLSGDTNDYLYIFKISIVHVLS